MDKLFSSDVSCIGMRMGKLDYMRSGQVAHSATDSLLQLGVTMSLSSASTEQQGPMHDVTDMQVCSTLVGAGPCLQHHPPPPPGACS